MATNLEDLQTLRARLEAEQLQTVELLASHAEAGLDFRRLADLHSAICAVRDEIARHGPRMGHGPDPEVAS